MSGKIVLFGATGFSGHLVAESMIARGLKPVLAARNKAKLEDLAGRLGGLESAVADVSDPSSVADLVEPGDVLVSTVGPFILYGEAALNAAVKKKAHYIDSTGEPGFIRRVFDDYGMLAKQAGICLLPSSGYDFVPGNCAAGAALQAAGQNATRVEVGYFISGEFEMSQGTRSSLRLAIIDQAKMFVAGQLVEMPGGLDVREFELDGIMKAGLSMSSTEHYSLPIAYPDLTDVRIYMGWFGKRTYAMQKGAAIQAKFMKIPGMTSMLRAILSRSVKSEGRGPDAKARADSKSHIVAEAFNETGNLLARADMTGADGYSFTGGMIAWMAEKAIEGKLKNAGAVGPVEVFGLEALIDGCKQAGLDLTIKRA